MSFEARLRIPGNTRIPLGVEVDITNERMTVTSGDRRLADWPLEKLDVSSLPDGFHIKTDGEEIVLNVSDANSFADRLGVSQTPRARPISPASVRRRYASEKPAETRVNGATGASNAHPHRADTDPDIAELNGRMAMTGEALASETVSPPEAFAMWLTLLKDLNHLHTQGSIATAVFHRLNTQVLELIPEPELTRSRR